MDKVYISGGITGINNYRVIFKDAENYLWSESNCVPVNPVRIGDDIRFPDECSELERYGLYMKEDLKALLCCDRIYMLKGWELSKGARFEHDTAVICGISVSYEE